jgi:hypothetical protein
MSLFDDDTPVFIFLRLVQEMPKKEDGNKNGRKVKQIKKVKNKMMTT